MFAQFFVAPLLTASSSGREVMAVNAEHQKNIDNDAWRQYQLLKSTTNPQHPYHKFSTGNLTTLQTIPEAAGINVHAELLKFFASHYVASNMRLAVLGKESLDELEQMVAPKFVNITSNPAAQEGPRPPLYLPNGLGKCLLVHPVADRDELAIFWPLPSVLKDQVENPIGGYISLLLGHEGSGSLLAVLKAQGLATGLQSGLYEDDKDFSYMSLFIELSPQGVQQHDQVVSLVYSYLKLLTSSAPQQWIFDENRLIDEISWLFPDEAKPATTVQLLASLLQVTIEPSEIFLEPKKTAFDAALISSLLALLTPKNSLVFVTSQALVLPTVSYEYWYGTPYYSSAFTAQQLSLWTTGANPALFALPSKNPFIVATQRHPSSHLRPENSLPGQHHRLPCGLV